MEDIAPAQLPDSAPAAIWPPPVSAQVRIGPVPAWVVHEAYDLDAPPEDQFVKSGLCLLLNDRQHDLTGAVPAYHTRAAYRVVTAAGASAIAQFSITFDPSLQALEIHHVLVRRGGQVTEYARGAAFQLMRREQNMERHILDGRLTAALIVPDVRPGDIVEHCWTVYGNNHFLRSCFSDWVSFGEAALSIRHRLRAPASRRVNVRYFGKPPEATEEESGGIVDRRWSVTRNESKPYEPYTPPWRLLARSIQLSEAEHWTDVSRLFAPQYEPISIPQGVRSEADRIATQSSDAAVRMMEVLSVVQQRMRYLALSFGDGGYIPRSLDDIWSTGYGDCKDASRLFVTLARLCGLDAAPALIATMFGPALKGWLPSPTVFNHCIVRVAIGQTVYWIDPTRHSQASLAKDLINPYHGWALPLTAGGSDLEEMAATPARLFMEVHEKIIFGPKVSSPASLELRVDYFGLHADTISSQIANQGLSPLTDTLKRRYQAEWPGISIKGDPRVENKREENRVTVMASYIVNKAWTAVAKGRVSGRVVAHDMSNELGALLQTEARENEIYLGFPRIIRCKAELEMPIRWPTTAVNRDKQIPGASYLKTIISPHPRHIVIEEQLTVSALTTPATEAAEYAELAAVMTNHAVLTLAANTSGDSFKKFRGKGRRWTWIWVAFFILSLLAQLLSHLPNGRHDQSSAVPAGPTNPTSDAPQSGQ